ncbi:MAG: Hint domain-containing protein [Pseudomonadota bacterium]
MVAGNSGTFVLSWAQTEINGLGGAPVGALELGAQWRWRGEAMPLGRGEPEGAGDLRAQAARAARQILGATLPPVRPQDGCGFDEALLGESFTVTDGIGAYTLMLLSVPEAARPLLVCAGQLPPADTDLWVARGIEPKPEINVTTESPTGVICFTPGTLLRTPEGERPVEELREGDQIATKDSGGQEIVWIGARRMTGARLYAMPELRPVRIRDGALGNDDPKGDLVVSPRHKVLVQGAVAQALFNTDEVLVAAEDLINDRTIGRDHGLRDVTYVHLLLPRHHIVWANGVETESFHPASTDLATVEPAQRARLSAIMPGIEIDPHGYGAAARRELSKPEAALLWHEGPLFA